MATDFLNEARRDRRTDRRFLRRTESLLSRECKSRAAPDGADDTALLAEPLLKCEKITAAGPDGGYGDAGTGATGGLRRPEKGRL